MDTFQNINQPIANMVVWQTLQIYFIDLKLLIKNNQIQKIKILILFHLMLFLPLMIRMHLNWLTNPVPMGSKWILLHSSKLMLVLNGIYIQFIQFDQALEKFVDTQWFVG